MVCTALQARGGRTPTRFSRWRRQRLLSRFPNCGIRFDTHHILQSDFGERRAELCALPITGVRQDYSHGNLLFHRLPNLLQRNVRLGLKRDLFRNACLSTAFCILSPYFR